MTTITLNPQLEKFVQDTIKSGRFASESEVMREALYLLEQKEAERERKLEALRADIAVGLEDSRAGRVVYAETVFAHLAEKSAERRKA